MDFQQSQTYKNILDAFKRELQVSTLYSIYADRAEADGYIEISQIFNDTLRNEKEHARIFLKKINNGIVPPTLDNLNNSAAGELEAADHYRGYAKTAQEEGFSDIAALFNGLANIELNHNLNFRSQAEKITNNQEFCKKSTVLWICMQCGNIMSGTCAPQVCPVCGFPQGYYKLYISTESDNL